MSLTQSFVLMFYNKNFKPNLSKFSITHTQHSTNLLVVGGKNCEIWATVLVVDVTLK